MTLRIVHTSDWHLGQTLKGHSREYEHAAFFDWLLDVLEEEKADALLVAGDIFDRSIVPASAEALYFDLIHRLRTRLPALDLVFIGGNHDPAGRLDAPAQLLNASGVTVVGGYDAENTGRMLVPLTGGDGAIAAWVAAVPFLRRSDYSAGRSTAEGYSSVYETVLQSARTKVAAGQALIGMGHCHMAGGALQESVRDVLRGNEEAVPASIFPSDIAYAALGHLHLAQEVGESRIRYCGSPIPLSMSETGYTHQILVADFDGDALTEVRSRTVPRAVPFRRLEGSLNAVLAEIPHVGLPDASVPSEQHAFVDVLIHLDKPEPLLGDQIKAALTPFGHRLVSTRIAESGCQKPLVSDVTMASGLQAMTPQDIFRKLYAARHSGEPNGGLLDAYNALVQQAETEAA